MVGDVTRTGSSATRMRGVDEYDTPDWSDGQRAEDRRRSFAALSTSRISGSAPTIEDIEVDSSDDDEEEEEKDPSTRLLSKDIEVHGDDLYLEEPLPIPTTMTLDDCSPTEELDQDPRCRRISRRPCVATTFTSKNLCRFQRRRWTTALRWKNWTGCRHCSRSVPQRTGIDVGAWHPPYGTRRCTAAPAPAWILGRVPVRTAGHRDYGESAGAVSTTGR